MGGLYTQKKIGFLVNKSGGIQTLMNADYCNKQAGLQYCARVKLQLMFVQSWFKSLIKYVSL